MAEAKLKELYQQNLRKMDDLTEKQQNILRPHFPYLQNRALRPRQVHKLLSVLELLLDLFINTFTINVNC